LEKRIFTSKNGALGKTRAYAGREWEKMVIVRFDLRDDVPHDVGHIFAGKTVKKVYSQEHVPAVLDCIAGKVRSAKFASGQKKVDVLLFGFASEQILMILSANLSHWDDIANIHYGNPHALPCKIFPIDID
jgi:hypothetical protein